MENQPVKQKLKLVILQKY